MAEYADVVFPLKIPPLTYKTPAGSPADLKGRIVKAPLMGRSAYGLVVDVCSEADGLLKKELKEIQSVHEQYSSETDIQFLKWLSNYYMTPMGIALKSSFFEEVIKCSKDIKAAGSCSSNSKEIQNSSLAARYPSPDANISLVREAVREKAYKTLLLHAPSLSYEYSFLAEVIAGIADDIKGIIILVPEIGRIERMEFLLKPILDQRLCVLHGKLGKTKRTDAVRRLISGESDIVIGTRSAVLAPLRGVFFIGVMTEHSPSYKAEEGLRYNARDVAVMKGFIEKKCVLVSSVCPSLESVYNAGIGKYAQINGNRQEAAGHDRPKIRIIAAKPGKKYFSSISGELLQESKKLISKREGLLFLVNRKGYSLIRCGDCGNILKCGRCFASLVFHKGGGTVSCRYCGRSEGIPAVCGNCGGAALETFGAGTERVKEELEETLKTEALIVEKNRSAPEVFPPESDVMPFIVGTGFIKGKVKEGAFGAAAFLNIDALLSQPDFRAHERTFQEIIQVSQMVKSNGRIFLQTHMPGEQILRFIRDYDFAGFCKYELLQRRGLGYQPFTRMVLFNILAKKAFEGFWDEVRLIMAAGAEAGLDALGPVEMPSYVKSYKLRVQIMIKSKDSRTLHAFAKKLLDKLEKNKGLRISVDVDPLKI